MSNGMPFNVKEWTLNDLLMKRIACSARLINFLPQSFLDLNFAPPNCFLPRIPRIFLKRFSQKDSWGIRNDIRRSNFWKTQQHQRSIGLWPSKARSFGFGWPCRITGNTRDYRKDPFLMLLWRTEKSERKISTFPTVLFLAIMTSSSVKFLALPCYSCLSA